MSEGSQDTSDAKSTSSAGSQFDRLVAAMGQHKASEMLLMPDAKPSFKIAGSDHEVGNRPLKKDEFERIAREAMSPEQFEAFEAGLDIEFTATLSIGIGFIRSYSEGGVPVLSVRRAGGGGGDAAAPGMPKAAPVRMTMPPGSGDEVAKAAQARAAAPGPETPPPKAAERPIDKGTADVDNLLKALGGSAPAKQRPASPSKASQNAGSDPPAPQQAYEEKAMSDDLKELASIGKQDDAGGGQNWKDLEKLFIAMAKNKASDLHLKCGMRPAFRIATVLHDVGNRPLKPEEVERMMYEILSEEQIERYQRELDLDFAYSIPTFGRYRVNCFHDRGLPAMAVRRVNTEIPSFENLHLPPGVKKIPTITQGLVVVAGATGSGKSTTLASILQYINENRRCHLITVEDPIEYLFTDAKSFINQREVGIDVTSFQSALKHIVRQNPDVILVGEMRDHASFDAALQAAETGHLVFGTIHASSSAQTIGRILDLFPTERQELIRQGLVFNLKAILCQKLLPSAKEGVRMVPSVEIMVVNSTIQKLIMNREDKKIMDVVRGGAEEGMQDFNQSLVSLINQGLITKKVGLAFSPNPEQLKMNLQGIYLGEDHKILG